MSSIPTGGNSFCRSPVKVNLDKDVRNLIFVLLVKTLIAVEHKMVGAFVIPFFSCSTEEGILLSSELYLQLSAFERNVSTFHSWDLKFQWIQGFNLYKEFLRWIKHTTSEKMYDVWKSAEMKLLISSICTYVMLFFSHVSLWFVETSDVLVTFT